MVIVVSIIKKHAIKNVPKDMYDNNPAFVYRNVRLPLTSSLPLQPGGYFYLFVHPGRLPVHSVPPG